MGSLQWLTRRISSPPIAVVYGNEMIRLMQTRGHASPSIQGAVEVSLDDIGGIEEALRMFKGKRCVVCLSTSDILVQHIRVGIDEDETSIRERLLQHDNRWGNAELRKLCVKTTNTSGVSKQELLCVGVDRLISQNINENIEGAGAEVVAITVPLYASIRAFDKLYRRDGDDKMTSMLIDMEGADSMVMIAHGANCVFAHRTELEQHGVKSEWTPETDSFPQVIPMPGAPSNEFDRREENEPRGLCGVYTTDSTIDTSFTGELERCLRHHNSLFPDRAVDRIIFTGTGANDAERCSAIAASVGIEGFIADPSAWIDGAAELAAGPAWTTAAGMCLRYSEVAA